MKNLELYNKFRQVHQEAKKKITGGRLKGFTDINPMWRIKMLTEQFGICGFGWYFDIIEQKIIPAQNGEEKAFVTINLFIKINDEWSRPIQGIGGSTFIANEKNGTYVSDECFKMALTDAIGVACKSLGIGADVYFEKDRSKYDQPESLQTKKSDNPDIDTALDEIGRAKTTEELATIFNRLKELQSDSVFIHALTNRKNEITGKK